MNRAESRPEPLLLATAWLLIAGFMLQPLLAYLTTPMLVGGAMGGRPAAICTLRGIRYVQLAPGLPAIQAQQDGDQCPALKLIQLAASTQLPAPLQPPVPTRTLVSVIESSPDLADRRLHFSAYASRAPPLA